MLASRSWTELSSFKLLQKAANLRPLNLSAFEDSVMGENRVSCKTSSAASPVCCRGRSIWLAMDASVPHNAFPMIRANCRARFTAADFDFVVRTLARSQTDHISLVDLLSDLETRDSILDHPRLVDAILNHCGHLRISSQFYFYVLDRHVLQQGGIADRKLCDYVASLLETFS